MCDDEFDRVDPTFPKDTLVEERGFKYRTLGCVCKEYLDRCTTATCKDNEILFTGHFQSCGASSDELRGHLRDRFVQFQKKREVRMQELATRQL